jgi:hypothetical protein
MYIDKRIERERSRLARAVRADNLTAADAMTAAVSVYRTLALELQIVTDKVRAAQSEAKAVIAEIIDETGIGAWDTPAGSVYTPADGTCVKYDADALDTLAAVNSELAALITPFRIVTERPGRLTVRGPQ